MAPILLDSRSLLKLSSFVLTSMIVMFAGGYLLGFEAAVDRPVRVSVPLAELPEPEQADLAAYEPQVPDIIEPGLHIDVDLPDPPAEQGTGAETVAESSEYAGEDASLSDAAVMTEAPATKKHEPLQVALLDLPAEVTSDAVAVSAVIDADQAAAKAAGGWQQIDVVDTATPESARYSVQVGMFSEKTNAERNLRQLESIDLSAYIDEYTNDRDESRFNVRFGWFGNKADALAALSVYENTHGGAGYVVYLKREKPVSP